MSQQKISLLEQKNEIEDVTLEKIAKVLQVPVEAIKNMNDEITQNFISTFHDNSALNQYNFNPIEKIVELYNEKEKLYERLLKSEQDKIVVYEKLLKDSE